jgi:hypothetical protein
MGLDAGRCVVVSPLAEGDRCLDPRSDPNNLAVCLEPLICGTQAGVCVQHPKRGEPCVAGGALPIDTCAQGSVCDAQRGLCVEPAKVGSACDVMSNLCEGYTCIAGKCRQPLELTRFSCRP